MGTQSTDKKDERKADVFAVEGTTAHKLLTERQIKAKRLEEITGIKQKK